MDRLRSLEVLVEIADRGSMARAADALGMSPTMVTTHLARLEERLGKRLFDRSTRRMDLTPAGRDFLERARHILASVEAAEDSLKGVPGTLHGRVRIDVPASLGRRFLLPAISAFRAQHPRVMLDLTFGDRGTVFRPHGFDVLIRAGEAGPIEGMHARTLTETRLIHVASPAYLARRGTPRAPDEIEGHDAILYASIDRPEGVRWRYRQQGAARWLRPNPVLTFNDGEAITAAAVAGLGIARMIEMLVTDELADGRLVLLYQDLETDPVTISAIAPLDRYAAPAVAAVLDFLEGIDWHA